LITGVSGDGTGLTWRPPAATRMAMAVCLGVFTALPGLWLALTLVTNQVPAGGWIALALAVAVWGLLAWRTLAQSVTLTPDTLVIRNILATERVPLADVTEVGFRRGRLRRQSWPTRATPAGRCGTGSAPTAAGRSSNWLHPSRMSMAGRPNP
jgi:hypothetical protein